MLDTKIDYDQQVRERFIPLSSAELAELLVEKWHQLHPQDSNLSKFIEALAALYDVQFAQQLEDLKRWYLPYNPDRETVVAPVRLSNQDDDPKQALISKIEATLQQANFNVLDQAMLNEALNKTSPYGVEVSVDLDEFQETLIYYRGTAHRIDSLRTWKSLFLKKENIEIPIYRRLFVLLQVKPGSSYELAPIYIKLFRDIPHSDLETIFPNTKVRMKLFDKIKLAVTGGGGAVGGLASALGKLSAAANPTAAIGAIGAIGGILWKQVSSVLTQRTQYMMQLAKNLYFYNLDNNLGALAYLVELASSEEHKEALLGYYFLLVEAGQTEEELDLNVEGFVKEELQYDMDYEVKDGLNKLRKLGILKEKGHGNLYVSPPNEALAKLKSKWVASFVW